MNDNHIISSVDPSSSIVNMVNATDNNTQYRKEQDTTTPRLPVINYECDEQSEVCNNQIGGVEGGEMVTDTLPVNMKVCDAMSDNDKKSKTREKVIKEIFDSEKSYQHHLSLIIKVLYCFIYC